MASWQIYPLLAKICFNLTSGIGRFYKYKFSTRTKAESANATRVSKNIHRNKNFVQEIIQYFFPITDIFFKMFIFFNLFFNEMLLRQQQQQHWLYFYNFWKAFAARKDALRCGAFKIVNNITEESER